MKAQKKILGKQNALIKIKELKKKDVQVALNKRDFIIKDAMRRTKPLSISKLGIEERSLERQIETANKKGMPGLAIRLKAELEGLRIGYAKKVIEMLPKGRERQSLAALYEMRGTFEIELERGKRGVERFKESDKTEYANSLNNIYIAENMLKGLDKDIKKRIEEAEKQGL